MRSRRRAGSDSLAAVLAATGRLSQLVAAAAVVAALVVFVQALDSGSAKPSSSPTVTLAPSTPTTLLRVAPPDAAAVADFGVAPRSTIKRQEEGALVEMPPAIGVAPNGFTTISTAHVRAERAQANGETIGVILCAGNAIIELTTTKGLKLFAPNGSAWLPIVGTVEDVNAALSTMRYRPSGSAPGASLWILASDFTKRGGASTYDVKEASIHNTAG